MFKSLLMTIVCSVWVIGWHSAPAHAQCCGDSGSSSGGSGHDKHAGHQQPVSRTQQPLTTEQPPHDGQIVATDFQHFEVVYKPHETRVYFYSRFQRPNPAYGLQGQVSMRVRGNDQVFRYPLQYATPPVGSSEQDYLVAVVDVTRIRDGDMMVTFDLANLPYSQEPRATFTQTFALSRARPQPNIAAVNNGFVITQATAADDAAIRTQRVCPVMNTQLGGHGVPIKVTVNGRSLFVCCGGCIAKLKERPDYYFAQRSP